MIAVVKKQLCSSRVYENIEFRLQIVLPDLTYSGHLPPEMRIFFTIVMFFLCFSFESGLGSESRFCAAVPFHYVPLSVIEANMLNFNLT